MAYPFLLSHQNTPRAPAACGRATKNPGAVSRPGGWLTFGEYAFLEDSRYASQANYAGNLMWRNLLRFYKGIGRSAWKARVYTRGRSPAEVCLQGFIRNHLLSLSLVADLGSIACADAGGLDYRTPLVDFRLKQRSERFGRRAFDNDAEQLELGPHRG